MKKIIVTGATSMVGAALVQEAAAEDIEVYVLLRPGTVRRDRLPDSERVHAIEAGLEQLGTVKGIPADCDTFYHFGWAGTEKTGRVDPVLQERNIGYTLEAVKLAARCGCRKFIGAGSQAEYGPVEGVITDETRFAPVTSYGAAKYAAGLMSRQLCDSLDIVHVWGRIFSVYGRNDNEGTMLDYCLKQFLMGEKACFSSGTQKWDYLYEKDAGRIFLLLGGRCSRSGTYRVAYGQSRKLKEYILLAAKELGAEGLCCFSGAPEKEQLGIQADTTALVKVTGYRPVTSFEEGVRETIEGYKARLGQGGQSRNGRGTEENQHFNTLL